MFSYPFPNTWNTITYKKCVHIPISFLDFNMFLIYQVRSFAARRCWLVIGLSLPNTYTTDTIHISKTASTSDKYYSSYDYFPLFFHEKWRPSLIVGYFLNYFLPMSLSSSIRSIYRKPHQNRTSSSRVIEEQTHRHTYFTLLLVPTDSIKKRTLYFPSSN